MPIHHPVTCDENECAAEVHIDFSFGNGNGFSLWPGSFGKADGVVEKIAMANGACQIARRRSASWYQFQGATRPVNLPKAIIIILPAANSTRRRLQISDRNTDALRLRAARPFHLAGMPLMTRRQARYEADITAAQETQNHQHLDAEFRFGATCRDGVLQNFRGNSLVYPLSFEGWL